MNEQLICELPHANYNKSNMGVIDFKIEDMPISLDRKKFLIQSFRNGKGIIGRMPKSNKLALFTPNSIKIIKQKPKNKDIFLPDNWTKYALVLKNNIGENTMSKITKSQLKEIIRGMVKEILTEKWDSDVKVKHTGEHAGKSIAQLKKEIEALRGKPGNKEKMGELLFALRAKENWPKGKGSAGLSKEK